MQSSRQIYKQSKHVEETDCYYSFSLLFFTITQFFIKLREPKQGRENARRNNIQKKKKGLELQSFIRDKSTFPSNMGGKAIQQRVMLY